MEHKLKDAWHQLQLRLHLDEKEAEERWWQVLVKHYGFGEDAAGDGGGRYYHSLTHVNALLDLCATHQASLRQRDLVELAVFFHDVIYDAKAKDNEEQSARLFEVYASEVDLKGEAREKVVKWILDTKTHTTADIQGDEDEAYFLDFDLSILGESEERYDTYARHIRREYAHFPDDAYRTGRAQVLETFLKVPSLFRTTSFKEAWEPRARSNVRREIDHLRSPAPL